MVNGRKVDPDFELSKGDSVSIDLPAPTPTQVKAEKINLKIVYEDSDILVIDKEEGMVVHPTLDHPSGTVVNALLYYLKLPSENLEDLRPGIVHRLDKGTSGLLVIAKNSRSLEKLKDQFKTRKIKKKYIALVKGKVEPRGGDIEKPIGRHPTNRKKFAVQEDGKEAQTYYNVIEYIGGKREGFSLVEVSPKTGRTHQIRVHMSSLGYPIVGDRLYGGKPATRIFLHASSLEFSHPTTGKLVLFESPLPKNLEEILNKVKEKR